MADVIEWLQTKARGFKLLSECEVMAISDFSLLWSLFESCLLNTRASAHSICNLVDTWKEAGTLDGSSFDPELAYFRQRYYAASAFTDHFHALLLRSNDQEALVRAVVDGTNNDPRDSVAAMLIIVFRYRNNLFHGVKWEYELAGQLSNFTTANSVLMKVLDRHGDLVEESAVSAPIDDPPITDK